ncbi:hypothetical protein EVAR_30543_1 [Eumeta japonica]|uniref:Uncharacterized protein n=1 Tax=Eumeta variegata TaxID=151549 RepID=A0A4C1VRQ0_EUMVA|nr:hypothetical protein EVAR_30543_1 [Eumeta japonica]
MKSVYGGVYNLTYQLKTATLCIFCYSHQKEDGHRYPRTLVPQRSHQRVTGLLRGNGISNGGGIAIMEGGKGEVYVVDHRNIIQCLPLRRLIVVYPFLNLIIRADSGPFLLRPVPGEGVHQEWLSFLEVSQSLVSFAARF